MRSNRKNSRWKLGIASAIGAAALAAPATAPADVSVKVGSTTVTLPVRNCERPGATTPESQTVTIPEITVPVTVGAIVPDLGAVNVTIGEEQTNVPINGQALSITVDGNVVDERDTATPPSAEASGPDAQPVDQSVTLPVSAELIGATTPADIAASSCKQEASAPSEQSTEEQTPESQPQPETTPESQPQPEPQPESQPQGTTQTEAPAQQQSNQPASTQQPASNPQHRAVTSGKDKAKTSKKAKKSKKKAKKSKPKRKKSKSKKNRRR